MYYYYYRPYCIHIPMIGYPVCYTLTIPFLSLKSFTEFSTESVSKSENSMALIQGLWVEVTKHEHKDD